MHSVAEAARKVACAGATPVAATNCLNFAIPRSRRSWRSSRRNRGMTEACNALGTPITGGNVSFYNETLGEGIYPTPTVGIVGIMEDVTKVVSSHFQGAGEALLVLHKGDAAIPRGIRLFRVCQGSPRGSLGCAAGARSDPGGRLQNAWSSWRISA